MSKNCAVINDTGIVLNIVVCHDDEPESTNLIVYTESNPAYIGGTFDSGYFYPPQPYPSWSKDGEGNWQAPTPKPEGNWIWNEQNGVWEQIS